MNKEWFPEYDENKRTINLVEEKGDDKQSLKKWANGLFSDKEIDNLYSSMEGGKIDLGDTEVDRFVDGFMNDRADNCDFNCFSSTQSGEQDFNEKTEPEDFLNFVSSNGLTKSAMNSESLKDAKPFKSYFGYSVQGDLDHVSINAGKDHSGKSWMLTKNGIRPINADGSLGEGARFKFQKGTVYKAFGRTSKPDIIYK